MATGATSATLRLVAPTLPELIVRVARIEFTSGSVSCPNDWRVIEFQIARAEEKVERFVKANPLGPHRERL